MNKLNFTKFINFLNDLDDFYEKGKRSGFKTESLLNSSYSTEQQFNHALINEVFPKELLQVMNDNILFNEPLRMLIGNKPLLEDVKGKSMQKLDPPPLAPTPRVQETINNVFQSHLEPIIEYLRTKEKRSLATTPARDISLDGGASSEERSFHSAPADIHPAQGPIVTRNISDHVPDYYPSDQHLTLPPVVSAPPAVPVVPYEVTAGWTFTRLMWSGTISVLIIIYLCMVAFGMWSIMHAVSGLNDFKDMAEALRPGKKLPWCGDGEAAHRSAWWGKGDKVCEPRTGAWGDNFADLLSVGSSFFGTIGQIIAASGNIATGFAGLGLIWVFQLSINPIITKIKDLVSSLQANESLARGWISPAQALVLEDRASGRMHAGDDALRQQTGQLLHGVQQYRHQNLQQQYLQQQQQQQQLQQQQLQHLAAQQQLREQALQEYTQRRNSVSPTYQVPKVAEAGSFLENRGGGGKTRSTRKTRSPRKNRSPRKSTRKQR